MAAVCATGGRPIVRITTVLAATCVIAIGLATNIDVAAAAPDSAIVVDAKTGKTLYASAADAKRYPASLTKMMTLYLLFEAIEDGRTSLNDRITISAHAAAQAPSKLGLKPGQAISVRDAILSEVTKSANDIAAAIGEHLAGSESNFARQMTAKARTLGMTSTTFRNASGLPDTGQVTTARDMATLGRALREHYPQYYAYFSTPSFVWAGRRITNHNRLLGNVRGVDGIKTGYTHASGFNLASSAKQGNREIVAVVIGGETSKWRDSHTAALIRKYLPRASDGPHTAFIPGGPHSGRKIALEEYPAPRLRPANGAFAAGSVATAVAADSRFVVDAAPEGDAAVGDEAQALAAPTALAGWKIQIAAAPTQSSAESLLDRALADAPGALANASPYTESVVIKGTTLHRARFAGFSDKAAARAACAALIKRDFDCLALSD